MAEISTALATPDRWNDVQHALTGGGDGKSCQCMWWMLANADWKATSAEERRELFHDEIRTGPPPGLVAYVDGEPAGWVRISTRSAQARLPRTRNIAAATREPFDDASVWAMDCFAVKREHRGHGLMSVLLDAAVDYARDAGARVIEAYPVDTSTGKQRSNDLYLGTKELFAASGFEEVADLKPGRPLMALTLQT